MYVLSSSQTGDFVIFLDYTDEELVSIDFTSTRVSSTFDAGLTNSIASCVNVVAWYDNEAGYSNRLANMCSRLAKLLA